MSTITAPVSTVNNSPLVNIGSIASLKEENSSLKSPVIYRFYLQSLSRELLSGEAVASCLRKRQRDCPTVDVYKNADSGRVRYSGLQTCKSIWHCPVCAARISEGRRQELSAALLDAHITNSDGSVIPLCAALITYTFQHNRSMSCADSVKGILASYRRLKSGKGYQELKSEYGFVGSVRSLEITWGEKNGWHPHIHELMLFNRVLSPSMLHGLKKSLKLRWQGVLAKEYLTASYTHGVDLRTSHSSPQGAVLEYIAKFGREPKEQKADGWTITHELVKSGSKRSGGDGHYSMLELLEAYGNGDVPAGRLWREQAVTMKGRNQLVWSRGLRDLLGVGQEKSDADLVDEIQSDADRRLASLSVDQWHAVLKADVRGELLVKAEKLSEEDFNLWLADLFARWLPAADDSVKVSVGSDGAYQFI